MDFPGWPGIAHATIRGFQKPGILPVPAIRQFSCLISFLDFRGFGLTLNPVFRHKSKSKINPKILTYGN
jgi:hypothetical protein